MIARHVLVPSLAALTPLWLAGAPTELPIRWDTSPACVDAAAVPARVAALVGAAPVPAVTVGLGAERHGGADGWTVSLVLEPRGATAMRRTLEGRDCATLTEAVVLVVAVHLDALAAAGVITGERDASAVPPVESATPREGKGPASGDASGDASGEGQPRFEGAAPREGSRAAASGFASGSADPGERAWPRSRPQALASVAAAGEVGVQPRAGAAFELAGGVGWSHVRVELGALASVGPDATSERLATVGGRFRLLAGLVRGCGVAGSERLELPLCGGLELGDLRATGTGLRRPATVDAPWVAIVASARPQWSPRPRSGSGSGERRRARLALGALLDLVVPLRRHRFATAEAGLVHAVDPVAVRLGLRLELRLP